MNHTPHRPVVRLRRFVIFTSVLLLLLSAGYVWHDAAASGQPVRQHVATRATHLLSRTAPGRALLANLPFFQTATARAATTNHFTPSNALPLAPTLGNYAAASVNLAQQTTVTPDAAPTNASTIVATASSGFNGTLAVNPTTGAVRVTNASPAGDYTITVKATNTDGTTTKTFVLTVENGTACVGTPLFTAGASITGIDNFLGTAVGDFNNDGKQDLAVINSISGNPGIVTILLGDGAGGFTNNGTVGTSNNPIGIAVGDLNGDGNQDLAIVCSSNNTVNIRLGNGTGTFSGTTSIAVGSSSKAIALADFNSDGKLDFVTANGGSNTASVGLGNGDGTFTSQPAVSTGVFPGSVVVADFNQDGKLDFATSNQHFDSGNNTYSTSATVSVRLGDGAGGFTSAPDINVGTNPELLAVGDFNEDGTPDLVTANQNSASLSVILGDVSAGPTVTTISSLGFSPGQIVVADINNDGHQDLAAKDTGQENFRYLFGTGTGSFGSPVQVALTGAAGTRLTVGDFNNDGKQDFVSGNFAADIVVFALSNGCDPAPTITPAATITRQRGSSAGAAVTIATVTDMNASGTDTKGAVTVTVTTVPTGITIGSITNTNGTITAQVSASCSATLGNNTVVLTVTDASNYSVTANLIIDVTNNTAPTLTYNGAAVAIGGSTSNTPTAATDNGSITGYAVQSNGTYTGTISVNSSGVVSISSAAPLGMHTITIRATDNCGATKDATFTLTVNTNSPTITAASALSRQRGSASSNSPIATVGHPTQSVGTLAVTATTVPTGLSVTNIVNNNGAITANIAADCTATIGNNTVVLTVADDTLTTATANLTVNVSANSAPTVGTYANSAVVPNGSLTITPTAAPSDNGSVTNISVAAPGFTGTLNGNLATGAITVTNAGPVGDFTVTVTLTDNCSTQSQHTFTLTVGLNPPLKVSLGDPAICLDANGLVGVEVTVSNPNNSVQPAAWNVTLPGGLTAVAGSCTANVNPGGCAIAANGGSVSWNGTLAANQTVTIIYRARIGANAGGGQFCLDNQATVAGVNTALQYCFNVTCPNLLNARVADTKPGSVLVFPYYTSTIGGGSDTRMTISNISNAASTAANQTYVHLFFIDGTSCQQADLFLCLTPNASFSFKASEYDPGNTGYLLAVAVDRNGVPVQNNVLMGNAFVTTPTLADNYSAESFWANSFAVATVNGDTATLWFDQVGYDAVPRQFAVEIQSPADAVGQQIVTASLTGNLTTAQLTGAAQVGSGLAFNEKEVFGSFNGWLTGACQARATITTNSPRVPNSLGNLIKTGQAGMLKFNVGGAVGLLLTPRTNAWKGIRTLHKTQTTGASLTIPILVPVC